MTLERRIVERLTIKTIVVLVLVCFAGQSFAIDSTVGITINAGGKPIIVEPVSVRVTAGPAGMAVFTSEDVEYLSKSGEPQIPWKALTVLLPPNADLATVSCGIVSAEYETIEGVWTVAPVPPILTSDADSNEEIEIWPAGKTIVEGRDADIYSADALWPAENVQLTGTGKLRGWRLAEIAVPLVLYNPVSGEVLQLVQAEISVDYDKKGKGDTTKGRKLGRAKKLAINFDDAAGLYEAAKGGKKTKPKDAPASDDDTLSLSPTGSSGYVIITTNDIRANSTKLADFVAHKQSLDFTVTVVDEDDTGATVVGDPAATKLREWLQANYIAMDLKYALIIGDPRPNEDYVPMKLYPCGGRNIPTDYFYAELTCDWDSNENGIIGESGEIERYFEVYVGRIPYYGVIADTDAILQKTIDYENSTDTDWRRHTLISNVPLDSGSMHGYNWGEQVKHDLLEPRAIPSDRAYRDGYGHTVTDYYIMPPPEFPASAYPATVWSQGQYGLHVWSTHGWAKAGVGICSTDDTPNLNDNYPSTVFQGSCDNAYPEFTDNLSYSILKNGGIVTLGATRLSYYMSESNFSNTPTDCGMSYRYAKGIVEGKSCGAALWDLKEEISSWWNHNWTLFNPYGDPSVVVMGEIPDFQITPTDCFYTQRGLGLTDQLESRTYTLLNNSSSPSSWTASKTASWFDISPVGGSIPAASSVDVVVTLNSGVGDLRTLGVRSDTITFTDTTHNITLLRDVECEIGPAGSLKLYLPLDETTGTTASDLSVYNRDGTLVNTEFDPNTAVPGQFGGALDLDGIDESIELSTHAAKFDNLNQGTIAAWFKTTGTGTHVIVAASDGGDGSSEVRLFIEGGRLIYDMRDDSSNPTGEAGNLQSATGVNNGIWHHAAVTVDSSNNAVLYLDGSPVDSDIEPFFSGVLDIDKMCIGRNIDSGGAQWLFSGPIDEVRIYDRVLSPAEIDGLIEGGAAESPQPYNNIEDVDVGVLRWAPGAAAIEHDVYIGTSQTAVANATQASPEYKGTTPSTYCFASDLIGLTQYYWRVDTVTASTTITGSVWTFTTASQVVTIDEGNLTHLTMDTADINGSTVEDVSGAPTLSGTNNGATEDLNGQINEGLSFDGTNDYVDLSTHVSNFSSLDQGTISAWFKTTGTGAHVILAASDGGDASSEVRLFVEGSRLIYDVRDDSSAPTGEDGNLQSATGVNNGAWHHAVITVDSSNNAVLYLDGSSVASSTEPFFSGVLNIDTMGIGRNVDSGGGQWYYTGSIDDVAVWDRPLDPIEIDLIYQEGLAGRTYGILYSCSTQIAGDINNDCIVDLKDFGLMASNWMQCNLVPQRACPE